MMTAIAVAADLLATSVPPPADPLTTEIGALDAKVFDAYNRCDLPTFPAILIRRSPSTTTPVAQRSSVMRWWTAFANIFVGK